MARRKKEEPTESVLEKEPNPVMGVGTIIEEEIDSTDPLLFEVEEAMLGSIILMVVDLLKENKMIWGDMAPETRDEQVARITARARPIIYKAVQNIAANGRRIVMGTMKTVTIKDFIVAQIECPRSPEACSAFGMSSAGGLVALLLLDADQYLQVGEPINTGGQLTLPFVDGHDTDTNEIIEAEISEECPL